MPEESAANPSRPQSTLTDFQRLSMMLLEDEPVLILDSEGYIRQINTAAERTLGKDGRSLMGLPFPQLVPVHRQEQVNDLLDRCLAGEAVRNVECVRQGTGQLTHPVSLTFARIQHGAGKPTSVAVSIKDISELKLLEARLQRMTKVFMDADDPIMIRDLQGRIIEVNDEVERTFGWSRDELIGKRSINALPEEWRAKFEELLQRCLGGTPIRNLQLKVPDKQGNMIYVLATVSLLTGESGEPLGIAQIIKNVTELRLAMNEIERTNRELEQFAAVVAHDLQQPLSTVKGYCDLMERHHREELSPQALDFLQKASGGIQQAQRLVGELLRYACLDERPKPASPTSCRDAVQRAMANLQSLIRSTDAVITCRDLPFVLCDASQLVQLFENLLANGLKYRSEQPPQIEVSAERVGHDSVICVADNGIGIEPAQHARIFDIFTRLHDSEDYPGTGIGLAICRKIVERHGGRIWVESATGAGSRFLFCLPLPVDDSGRAASQVV